MLYTILIGKSSKDCQKMNSKIIMILISLISLTKHTLLISHSTTGLSQRCVNRWSRWINDNTPSVTDMTNSSDVEVMTTAEKRAFCGAGNITSIECETVDGIPSYSSGEILQCNIYSGLVCLGLDNFPIPCTDYKIRYFCTADDKSCPSSSTDQTSVRVQPTTSNFTGLSNNSKSVALNPSVKSRRSRERELSTGRKNAIIVGSIMGILMIVVTIIIGIIMIKKKARKQKVGLVEEDGADKC